MKLLIAIRTYKEIYEENSSSNVIDIFGINKMTVDMNKLLSNKEIGFNIYNIIADLEINISLKLYNKNYFINITQSKHIDINKRFLLFELNKKNNKLNRISPTSEKYTKQFINILHNNNFTNLLKLINSRIVSFSSKNKDKDDIYDMVIKNIGSPIDVFYNADGSQCLIYTGHLQTGASIIFMLFINKNSEICGYYYNIICLSSNIMSLIIKEPGILIYNNNNIYTVNDIEKLSITNKLQKGVYSIEQYRNFDNIIVNKKEGDDDEN